MKKYFLTTLIIAFTIQMNAQSNLVFNEVKIVNLAGGVIVPEGKVWKVEAFHKIRSGLSASINVDGEQFNVDEERVFWINGGSSISPGNESLNSGILSATRLNVIEFNVVAVSSGSGGGSGTINGSNDDFFNGGGQDSGDDYTPGESITDIDGNNYETVNIGNQTWTTTNLNVSKYTDGTPIPHITNWDEWRQASTGAYTYVAQTDNGYGKVYNYWAIIGKNDIDPNTPLKKLAPEGFHIPTEFEWNQLANIYGGVQSAGYYLKSDEGWATDLNGNNESGLNLKPGGYVEGFVISAGWSSTSWNPSYTFGTYYQKVKYGTKTINNSGNTFKSVMVYAGDNSFTIDTSNYINNPDIATACSGGCNTGVYIRLVKD
jgi:uncharacterized protein (TIGR02145 family)